MIQHRKKENTIYRKVFYLGQFLILLLNPLNVKYHLLVIQNIVCQNFEQTLTKSTMNKKKGFLLNKTSRL